MAKTPIRRYFCLRGRLKFLMTGIGRIMMAISVTMFEPALKYQDTDRDMHLLWSWVQKALIGMHWKALPNTLQHEYMLTNVRRARQTMENLRVMKTRRYWRRMEILVNDNERLYKISEV